MLGPGPGQLVQTADGRLVALGPGNTFYEVGMPANSHIQVIYFIRYKILTFSLLNCYCNWEFFF